MCCEGEIFHQTTGLTLRRIRGTDHSPLRWLQSSRTANFPCLLKLRVYTSHHSQRRDVRETHQNLSDALPLHFESLQDPVPAADRVLETLRDQVRPDQRHGVELIPFLFGVKALKLHL